MELQLGDDQDELVSWLDSCDTARVRAPIDPASTDRPSALRLMMDHVLGPTFPTSSFTVEAEDHGSVNLTWRTSDGMTCMVCVLTSAVVVLDQVHAFEMSLTGAIVSGRCNGGMLVVLEPFGVPGKGPFVIETAHDCPVVMVASKVIETLRVAASALHHVWCRFGDAIEGPPTNTRLSEEDMLSLYQGHHEMLVGVGTRRRALGCLQLRLDQDERCLAHGLRLLENACGSVPLSDGNPRETNGAGLVEQLLNVYDASGQWPHRCATGVTATQARSAGGYRSLMSRAKAMRPLKRDRSE